MKELFNTTTSIIGNYKPKASRKKEIIKILTEIHEIENRKPKEKFNETKSWFFKEINKTDKILVKLTIAKREKRQFSDIRNKRKVINTDSIDNKEGRISGSVS